MTPGCGSSNSAVHDAAVGGTSAPGTLSDTGGTSAPGTLSDTGGQAPTGGAPATGGAWSTGGLSATGGSATAPGTGGAAPTGGSSAHATGGAPTLGSLAFDLPVDLLPNNGAYTLTDDITGDGRRDAVWQDPYSVSGKTLITFAVAQTDGSYTPVAPITVPGSGAILVYGDFNADHRKDVVLPDTSNGSAIFRVYLGNGDGTFTPAAEYPRGLAGDFNNDGRTDSLTVGPSSWPSSYLNLSQADGTFVQSSVPFISNESYAGLGDFDGDGNLDVYLGLSVRRGLGNGTFSAPLSPTCNPCSSPAKTPLVVDLNGDGRSDLVVPYYWQFTVLLGQADGSLSESARIDFGSPQGMAVGQLDKDGNLDLAMGNGSGQLDLFYGDGAGNFQERRSYLNARGGNSQPTSIEDRNGDGLGDVVLDGHWAAYGRGQRRIRSPEFSLYSPTGDGAWAIVDFGHDGQLDFAYAYVNANIYQAAFSKDRYLKAGASCSGPGTGKYRRILDMTGDGLPDVVSFSGDLSVFVGQGGCTYAPAVAHAFNIGWAWLQKINDDNLVDVIFSTSGGLGITLATGPGTFATPVVSPFSGYASALAAADFTGDGNLDVVAYDGDKKLISIRFGDANHNLTLSTTMPLGSSETTYLLMAADIDADGDSDVLMGVVANPPSIDILRNDGQGHFVREKLTAADTLAGYDVADVDNDGKLELLADLSQQSQGIFRVGPTAPATLLLNLSMPRDSHLFDIDGDGDLDLVNIYPNYVAVANNRLIE